MSLTTYSLTTTVYDQEGQPLSGHKVTAVLTKTDYTTDGTIIPSKKQTETDSSGAAVLNLVSNLIGAQDSLYRVIIQNTSGSLVQSASIQMPEADTNLNQLVDQVPVDTEYSTAAALSATKAENEATSAESSATSAESSARRINSLFWLGV